MRGRLAAQMAFMHGVIGRLDMAPIPVRVEQRTGLAVRGEPRPDRTEAFRLGRELARCWAETKEGVRPNLEKLGKALREFGGNLETVRTGDLLLPGAAGSAASLSTALQEAEESAAAVPPLADVAIRIGKRLPS